jgi:hypothetical protein
MFRRIRFLLWLPPKKGQATAITHLLCMLSPSLLHVSKWSQELFVFFVHHLGKVKKHVSAMQWTLTQILVACAFPTLHFSVTWHPSEDVRYTLSFQPQELHRCTSGTFHWALQQGKDMRCLGGGVRFRNVLWHICQSLSVSASACSRALFEVETPVETACALFHWRCGDSLGEIIAA